MDLDFSLLWMVELGTVVVNFLTRVIQHER